MFRRQKSPLTWLEMSIFCYLFHDSFVSRLMARVRRPAMSRPLFLCAHCSSVPTVPLCPLFLCSYCSSMPTVPLCTLFLCSHCSSVPTVPLCLLFLCAHCSSSSVPTVPLCPLFLCSNNYLFITQSCNDVSQVGVLEP